MQDKASTGLDSHHKMLLVHSHSCNFGLKRLWRGSKDSRFRDTCDTVSRVTVAELSPLINMSASMA